MWGGNRCPIACFDPRSRAGSDAPQVGRGFLFEVSIRAPARGATVFT